MGIPTPQDKAAQEEHRKYRAKFTALIKKLCFDPTAPLAIRQEKLGEIIGRMENNLTTFTMESIRQAVENGRVDINTLPMAGAEPWKVKILEAVAVLDEPERCYQKRIDEAIRIMNDVVIGGSA